MVGNEDSVPDGGESKFISYEIRYSNCPCHHLCLCCREPSSPHCHGHHLRDLGPGCRSHPCLPRAVPGTETGVLSGQA